MSTSCLVASLVARSIAAEPASTLGQIPTHHLARFISESAGVALRHSYLEARQNKNARLSVQRKPQGLTQDAIGFKGLLIAESAGRASSLMAHASRGLIALPHATSDTIGSIEAVALQDEGRYLRARSTSL